MKNWVIAIYKIQSSLEDAEVGLRRQIERHTKDMVSETVDVCDKILELLSKKIRLCNLKVMFDEIMKSFSEDEKELFQTVLSKREFLSEIARERGINKSTMLRRFDKLIKKAECVLIDLRFDEDRLEREYRGLVRI
ncbi:MAG: hypothetical protein FWC11_00325 [Firmicutes bacterium]|nr:hypothetical protein [Bacillota bacterium]